MDETFSRMDDLVNDIKDYINVKLDALKLSVAEKISRIAAAIIAGFVVAVAVLFFVVFISIALGFFLGEILGSTWLGFLIVGGIYLLVGLVTWWARKRIIQVPIMNSILTLWSLKEEEDEED